MSYELPGAALFAPFDTSGQASIHQGERVSRHFHAPQKPVFGGIIADHIAQQPETHKEPAFIVLQGIGIL